MTFAVRQTECRTEGLPSERIYKIALAPTSNLYAGDPILIGATGFDREAVR